MSARRLAVLVVLPALVLAGAGSGKTSVITRKIVWLIRDYGIAPRNIVAVTFTNKAAREMKERVGHLAGPAVEGMPWLGTFHSIGARIIRRHAEKLGLTSSFTILDTDDQIRLLKAILAERNIDDKTLPPGVEKAITMPLTESSAACSSRKSNRCPRNTARGWTTAKSRSAVTASPWRSPSARTAWPATSSGRPTSRRSSSASSAGSASKEATTLHSGPI